MPTATTDTPTRLLSYHGAAAYLGLSRRKLWSLAASREIPTVRIGRAVRFDVADLDRFIQSSKSAR